MLGIVCPQYLKPRFIYGRHIIPNILCLEGKQKRIDYSYQINDLESKKYKELVKNDDKIRVCHFFETDSN